MTETIFDVLIRKLDAVSRDIESLKLIEFPVYVDGDGNGIAGRVAEWVDTKSIAPAHLVAPASNVLTLAAGGAYTLTVPATGTAALGAGTLTDTTSNSFTGASHTHAVTASSSPGSNASLLKTDSNGRLTLALLTVGSNNLVLNSNLTNQGGNGVLNWGGNYTLTISATGTATLGAGTLTAATSNNAGIANHTHAITASASPGANASLLKTDGSGGLVLNNLTLSSSSITMGGKTLTLGASGTVTLGAGTLTVSTSNDGGSSYHTHAITTSSNPGSNARILASTSGGGLTLQSLVTGSLMVGSKSLVLTRGLTVSGSADGGIYFSGAYTVTIPASNYSAMGADTLAHNTSNNSTIVNHTHAVSASSDTGASATLLKTNSSGHLRIHDLFTVAWAGIGTNSPSYTCDVIGACHATNFPTSSDRRLKTNITPITNALNGIKQVQPVYFEWNEYYETLGRGLQGEQQIGMIAQEMEAVYPQLVTKWDHPKKFKAIDYNRAVAVVWQAVRELAARVEALEGA